MKQWLSYPAVQIALCVAAYVGVGLYFGAFGFLYGSPLFAAIMARLLWGLASDLKHHTRARVWLPVHGKHFVFKDITIKVQEDEDHFRWVCLADVRKVVGNTASDRALSATYRGQLRVMGESEEPHLLDEAVVAHLSKINDPMALRFRTWVQQTIVMPGARIRERAGIRIKVPDNDDD